MAIDIDEWLRALALEQYAASFRDNDIDGDVLKDLTADDLTALGVSSVGHRRKLLAAIATLRNAPAEPRRQPENGAHPAAKPAVAERRQLTIMFCDVAGSTELAIKLDPEDLREVISPYHQKVAEVVARFGGFVAKYMGDGVLAYFGYPLAHEEDAEQAVRAALAVVEAVGRLDLSTPIAVRIGLATGLVVVGDLLGAGAAQEQSVIGETPNLAARLQSLAEPNAVVIADATRRQIGGLFVFRDLGERSLKGFSSKLRAWRVLGESGVVSRFEALRSRSTRLVGREEELDILHRRWTQAKQGDGRVALLSAEPGVGKSRLIEALEQRIRDEPHWRLRYFCSPHRRDSALHPLIEHLERAAGLSRDDDRQTRRGKLAQMLAAGEASARDFALIADLLSIAEDDIDAGAMLTPQQKKNELFDALMRRIEGLTRIRPALMVFEDLHWMDATSLDLLDRIIAKIDALPILLIATFRPDFQPSWIGYAHVTMLALPRLGKREGAALVRTLIGHDALPADVIGEIVERTDGVPLFLEELTKAALEEAASAARDAVAAIPGPRSPVPATLQASLMARLDRLGAAARELAQTGAAIGRTFAFSMAAAVTGRGDEATRDALDQLVAAGLLFQHGFPPAAEYEFKHALVQDTAYGTLLRKPRQELHRRIAAEMVRQTPDIVERSPELLAHHLAEAHEIDEAARYFLEAGRRASSRSANVEASAHLTRGLALLRETTATPARERDELALQLALGPVLLTNQGYGAPEAKKAYQRADQLAQKLEDDRARFAATWGLWLTAQGPSGQDTDNQLLHLGRLIEIARGLEDPDLTLQAHHSAWATRMWGGDLVRTRVHIREGLAIYDPDRHRHHALTYGGHDPGVCGKGQDALALWALGYPDEARQSARDSIALGERLAHVPSVLHALWFAGLLYFLRRDLDEAAACGDRLTTLGKARGFAQYEALGGAFRSWAAAQRASDGDARAEMRAHLAQWRTAGRLHSDVVTAGLAEAELQAGDNEGAASALAEAEKASHGWWRAEILRLRGELRRASPAEPGGAEDYYREAVVAAKSQQAKSLELRAATSLARLLADQGRSAEAREALAPIYRWFSEGFDTADLKKAKGLLETLGA